MESELLKLASSQGIWSALSVALIFYILKAQEKRDVKQEQREANYQSIIKNLTDKLGLLKEVKSDIKEVKEVILRT